MAYMNQEKKQKIAAALKRVMPAGFKYSLSVRHRSTIVCTINEAPFDLINAFRDVEPGLTHMRVNHYHFRSQMDDQCVADVLEAILGALNTDNHDRSDLMTDYFDVGHYVDLQFGRWDRPFKVAPMVSPLRASA